MSFMPTPLGAIAGAIALLVASEAGASEPVAGVVAIAVGAGVFWMVLTSDRFPDNGGGM